MFTEDRSMRTRLLPLLVMILIITNIVPTAIADEEEKHRPTARIITPQNNTQFDGGQKVTFIAEVFDKDGDDVTVIWSNDGKEMQRYLVKNGTGTHQWTKKLNSGATYTFELLLSDGDLENRYYLTMVIKTGDPPVHGPVFSMLDAVVAGSIAFGIVLVIFLVLMLGQRPVR